MCTGHWEFATDAECDCLGCLGAVFDQLGRGHIPTLAGLSLLGHSSPPALSAGGDTSSSVCCCQQHGWLPFWFCLEKACLFCRGLLEKHQNINPLIYLPISSPANLSVTLQLDTILSFLYDVRPSLVRLCSVHKYTNASSVCLWKSEKSWVRVSHDYSTDLHLKERKSEKCRGDNTFAQNFTMVEKSPFFFLQRTFEIWSMCL